MAFIWITKILLSFGMHWSTNTLSLKQLFNFSIDAAKSIVTQAHEFQLLAEEIASLGCPIPDRVVVVGIITKIPTSGGILPLV
jgi:hypothetical protein